MQHSFKEEKVCLSELQKVLVPINLLQSNNAEVRKAAIDSLQHGLVLSSNRNNCAQSVTARKSFTAKKFLSKHSKSQGGRPVGEGQESEAANPFLVDQKDVVPEDLFGEDPPPRIEIDGVAEAGIVAVRDDLK